MGLTGNETSGFPPSTSPPEPEARGAAQTMQRSGMGITVRAFMATIAMVAIALAPFVASPQSAAIAIVVACIAVLAYRRYSEAIAQNQVSGVTTGPLQKAGKLLASVALATMVIGLCDLAFLTGYQGYLRVADMIITESHNTPSASPNHMKLGWIFGFVLALRVASCMSQVRCTDHPVEPLHRRRWLKRWWPVGLSTVIGFGLVADHLWARYSFCQMMVEYHAEAEGKVGGVKNAALHAWLKQWYQRAAIRPWLPLHPDRLPSK